MSALARAMFESSTDARTHVPARPPVWRFAKLCTASLPALSLRRPSSLLLFTARRTSGTWWWMDAARWTFPSELARSCGQCGSRAREDCDRQLSTGSALHLPSLLVEPQTRRRVQVVQPPSAAITAPGALIRLLLIRGERECPMAPAAGSLAIALGAEGAITVDVCVAPRSAGCAHAVQMLGIRRSLSATRGRPSPAVAVVRTSRRSLCESSSHGRRLTQPAVSVIVLERRGGRRFARADRQ